MQAATCNPPWPPLGLHMLLLSERGRREGVGEGLGGPWGPVGLVVVDEATRGADITRNKRETLAVAEEVRSCRAKMLSDYKAVLKQVPPEKQTELELETGGEALEQAEKSLKAVLQEGGGAKARPLGNMGRRGSH